MVSHSETILLQIRKAAAEHAKPIVSGNSFAKRGTMVIVPPNSTGVHPKMLVVHPDDVDSIQAALDQYWAKWAR